MLLVNFYDGNVQICSECGAIISWDYAVEHKDFHDKLNSLFKDQLLDKLRECGEFTGEWKHLKVSSNSNAVCQCGPWTIHQHNSKWFVRHQVLEHLGVYEQFKTLKSAKLWVQENNEKGETSV